MNGGEVRLGDWRDVLPGTYDAAHAVVITDPPFGLGDVLNGGHRGPGSHPGREYTDKGFADGWPWAVHVASVLELLPAVRHVIRGPATALVVRDYPAPRRVCVEMSTFRRRSPGRPGVVPYLWIGWAVYGRLLVGRHHRAPLGEARVVRPFVDDGLRGSSTREHRGMTPYDAALWMIDTWADPGQTIVDPFAGTGTMARAAAALGFAYLGAELDPHWHARAESSLLAHQPALGL